MPRLILLISLAACSSAPAPTPTSTNTNTPAATPTNTPTATFTPTHTPTVSRTPSPTPRPTDTPTPTATPLLTPTPRATRVPPTPVPTATPAVAPQLDRTTIPFNVDGFIKSLRDAHRNVQRIRELLSYVTESGKVGSCAEYGFARSGVMGAFAFSDVPPAWQPLYIEYIRLLDGTAYVTLPVHTVCEAGGGTIDQETDLKMLSYTQSAELRLFAMIQEAEVLKASAP